MEESVAFSLRSFSPQIPFAAVSTGIVAGTFCSSPYGGHPAPRYPSQVMPRPPFRGSEPGVPSTVNRNRSTPGMFLPGSPHPTRRASRGNQPNQERSHP
jgi:hypothetical protein